MHVSKLVLANKTRSAAEADRDITSFVGYLVIK